MKQTNAHPSDGHCVPLFIHPSVGYLPSFPGIIGLFFSFAVTQLLITSSLHSFIRLLIRFFLPRFLNGNRYIASKNQAHFADCLLPHICYMYKSLFSVQSGLVLFIYHISITHIKKDNFHVAFSESINPLRPNSDLSQTSHCNIKGFSVGEVMRIENMITQVQFY